MWCPCHTPLAISVCPADRRWCVLRPCLWCSPCLPCQWMGQLQRCCCLLPACQQCAARLPATCQCRCALTADTHPLRASPQTYLNGYAREEALRDVRELPSSPSAEQQGDPSLQETGASGTFSPGKTGAAYSDTTAGKLPQWVENDRKVSSGGRAWGGAHARMHTCIACMYCACMQPSIAPPLQWPSPPPGPALLRLLQGGRGGEQH